MTTTWPRRLDVDGVDAAAQLDFDSRIALGYVAAQLACVIDANYPALGRDRIENLSIDFAYRLHLAEGEH
ncbi:MAG: hypothetical protein MUF80_02900 [Burkholderiales bacterium]|jgi:hypothetical protein|nr:hypothetical protein [Burkholderiales bacterium]